MMDQLLLYKLEKNQSDLKYLKLTSWIVIKLLAQSKFRSN